MKTIKKWISKFFIFVINILKDVLSCMRDEFEVRNQVEIEKVKATKEILIATGNGVKEILIAVGNTVKDAVKAPFRSNENMRITGILCIGVGSALIGCSFIRKENKYENHKEMDF